MNPFCGGIVRILLVDDDDLQLKFVESILVPLGHDVHSCVEGDEALAAYTRFAPWHWVITDYLFLPGQNVRNGLYLIKEMRKLDPQQNCIIQTSEESLPLPYGVKFLHKPFLPRTLLRMMREPVRPLLPLQ
jgi:CheY-like chemotaxis protein